MTGSPTPDAATAASSPRDAEAARREAARAARGELKARLAAIHFRRPIEARLAEAIDRMVENRTHDVEASAIVLAAESHAGKTTTVKRVVERHPALGHGPGSANRIVSVQVPGPCTLAGLGIDVCRRCGYPYSAREDANAVWRAARRTMQENGVAFLHLDEVQNVIDTANAKEAPKLRDAFRKLLVDLDHRVGLILSGQPGIIPFFESDRSLVNRIEILRIDPISGKELDGIRTTIGHAADVAKLRFDPNRSPDLVPRLVHAALGQFGAAVKMAKAAVLEAAHPPKGEAANELGIAHFAKVFAMKSGNAAFANPFLSDDWQALDCTLRSVVERPQSVRMEFLPGKPGKPGRPGQTRSRGRGSKAR